MKAASARRAAKPVVKRPFILVQNSVWNDSERVRNAELIKNLILSFSPTNIGGAYKIAGMFVECLDNHWSEEELKELGAAQQLQLPGLGMTPSGD